MPVPALAVMEGKAPRQPERLYCRQLRPQLAVAMVAVPAVAEQLQQYKSELVQQLILDKAAVAAVAEAQEPVSKPKEDQLTSFF
jgi:hypothetical protein